LNGSQQAAEPGGPLSAGATLVDVRNTAQGRRAFVKIDIVAHGVDAEATIFPLDADGKAPRGSAVGRASLPKKQIRSVFVETEVQADNDTHLFYRVNAQGRDGSFSEMTVYLRVPPEDAVECQTVGDYIQCQGTAVPQVQP
jgi:hypothetical protein